MNKFGNTPTKRIGLSISEFVSDYVQVILHKSDLQAIKEFTDKYPDSDYINITVDSSSGIGSIINASLVAVINEDMVTITKTIVDESSW